MEAARDSGEHEAYCRHIIGRTNGREPGGSKLTIQDYVTSARSLWRSMTADGYDFRFPVVVGSNGRLRDGAHRIACSLAVGIEGINFRKDPKPGLATEWGRYYLKSHDFSEWEVRQLEQDLANLLK